MDVAPLRTTRRASEDGNQIVEFGLLVPVFVFILMLAIDGGRMVMAYTTLKNAAREAALYAANHPSATITQLKSVAIAEGNAALTSNKLNLSVSDVSGTQSLKVVTLNYGFDFANPVLLQTKTLTMTVTAAAAVP